MTMSYIYKITNLINHHFYVGYTSQSISSRWSSHKWEALNNTPEENKSHLYNAMRYYGVDNFKIEPIYEFDETKEDWREVERYYIQKLDARGPMGYNLLEGGDLPPIHFGNENLKTKIKDEQLPELFEMLKDVSIPFYKIAEHFGVSRSQIYRINKGEFRKQENLNYPIRKYSQQEEYALQVMEILATDTTLSNSKIAELIPCYFRANEIASINTGKKYAYLWGGDFPIRKITVPNDYDEKQKIAREMIEYINQERKRSPVTQRELQIKFNASRYTVEKVIKGIYPYRIEGLDFPIKLTKLND